MSEDTLITMRVGAWGFGIIGGLWLIATAVAHLRAALAWRRRHVRRGVDSTSFARFAAEELGVSRRHVQVIDGREVIFRIGVVVPDSALLKLASAIGRRLPGQPVLIDVRHALPAASGRRPFHS